MKTVVVTGCLGFVGFCVTRACLSKGWRVLGIDAETYAANLELKKVLNMYKSFTYIKQDIRQIDKIPDCDYIVNLAAETHVGNSIVDSDKFVSSNIGGVHNLLKKLILKPRNVDKLPTLFHFSTDEVYGDIKEGSHFEEDALVPSNPYSATKAAADLLIKSWARTYDINYIIVRPTNNYGMHQYPEKLIPLAVKMLQRGKKIRLHNAGLPIRTWLHAEDTADAVTLLIESGIKNEIFNISGGFEQTNIDTVKKIIECYNKKKPSNWEDYLDLSYVRKGQDIRYSIDDSKIRKLDWRPIRDFDDEIENIVDFYKENYRW